MLTDEQLDQILNYRTIAFVGLSRDKSKDSHRVASYMKNKNYTIVPINPYADRILGEPAYPSLLEIPADLQRRIEIVDIFRPSQEVLPIVDDAIRIKKKYGFVKVIWMQLGILNENASKKAEEAGLTVIMDKCIMVEHAHRFSKI